MRGCRVGIELHTLSPISRAEADGNRTRLGALAPTPVLKTGGPTRNPDASAKQPTRGISMRVHMRVRPGYEASTFRADTQAGSCAVRPGAGYQESAFCR
jgi:hypothetical protein